MDRKMKTRLRVGQPTMGMQLRGVVEVHYGPQHMKQLIKGETYVDNYIATSVKTRVRGPVEIKKVFHEEWQ